MSWYSLVSKDSRIQLTPIMSKTSSIDLVTVPLNSSNANTFVWVWKYTLLFIYLNPPVSVPSIPGNVCDMTPCSVPLWVHSFISSMYQSSTKIKVLPWFVEPTALILLKGLPTNAWADFLSSSFRYGVWIYYTQPSAIITILSFGLLFTAVIFVKLFDHFMIHCIWCFTYVFTDSGAI